MENKKLIKLGMFIVVALVVALIWVVVLLIQENSECVNSPFMYGIKRLEEQGLTARGQLFISDPEGIKQFNPIYFNSEGINQFNINERGFNEDEE